jgi:hypothetical protein
MKALTLAVTFTVSVVAFVHDTMAAPSHSAARPTTKHTNHHDLSEALGAAFASKADVSGVIPRVVRGGKPLQIFDPFAPPEYGSAEQNTIRDPDLAGRTAGIKLLSIRF